MRKRARAKSTKGATNWQETRINQNGPHSLDACPDSCTKVRPHRVAAGLYVCAECWAYEHSDRPPAPALTSPALLRDCGAARKPAAAIMSADKPVR